MLNSDSHAFLTTKYQQWLAKLTLISEWMVDDDQDGVSQVVNHAPLLGLHYFSQLYLFFTI